ncbi:MAG: dicarboxylate/amino acid:cation symporter [Polyangiaceae bacterium]
MTSESAAAPKAKDRRLRFPLSLQIIAAMVLGLALGPLVGKQATPLAEVAKLVIQLIKAFATPLLFLAIVQAILKTEVSLRAGARMIGFALVNATIALTIGLVLSNLLRPGDHLAAVVSTGDKPPAAIAEYANKKIDLTKTLISHVPQNVVSPFAENAVIAIVILALFLGFALRRVREEEQGSGGHRIIEEVVTTLLRVSEVVLSWAIKLVPLAVFAVVTKTVGEYGFAPFKGLGWYVLVGLLGLVLQIGVTYQLWIAVYTRIGLRRFWREARSPVVYALGANSSLATLPLTLDALDRLGVSRASSALGACVGTNLNNDGILLYEGMAVLFVAQASGIDLPLSQQIVAGATCMIAAMGVAGVPEAGFISLALVLNTVGLPVELLPLLLTVDWVIARARSVTNVLSDMMLSILVDQR